MTDNRRLLPYVCQRAAVHAYEQSGRAINVRTKRGGGLLISLSGGRALCVHDAMRHIEKLCEREPETRAAFLAYLER